MHSLKLENVRSVRNGELVIHRGPLGASDADIIGIYGQNGSGKTTVVDAFSVMQHIMRGAPLPEEAEWLINMESDTANLLFRFIVEEPLDQQVFGQWEVTYEVTLARSDDVGAYIAGERIRGKQLVPKTCNARPRDWFVSRETMDGPPIGPDSLWREMRAGGQRIENEIRTEQAIARHEGRSFLFSKFFLAELMKSGNLSPEVSIIRDLSRYAHTCLFVVNKVHTGLIYTNLVLPLSFRHAHSGDARITASGGTHMLALEDQDVLPAHWFEDFEYLLTELNIVLESLVPGFSLRAEVLSERLNQQKEKEIKFELMASRGTIEIPFRYESNGVRRLVSILSLLLSVYNDPAVCVVIDELDVGIFEYLLGQLIDLLAQSGRGQLIFTSHNMRALEVLRPPQIVVTTTDAEALTRLQSFPPRHGHAFAADVSDISSCR